MQSTRTRVLDYADNALKNWNEGAIVERKLQDNDFGFSGRNKNNGFSGEGNDEDDRKAYLSGLNKGLSKRLTPAFVPFGQSCDAWKIEQLDTWNNCVHQWHDPHNSFVSHAPAASPTTSITVWTENQCTSK